ncbi:MAG: hypothetical protein DME44_04935 [Verrucomicrobia bacterium]|nr:MAG: hypothetical protein DME44_04935 [Verrucomicrobiota bacterium]
MQYKTGAKRNLREIADELGIANIVEGSVQQAGNRVRVRAQLIDARSDRHLWAERYDRPLDDVFAIQTDIAKAIADQLQAKLSPAEKAAIEQAPTSNLVAYDRYLRAKKFYEMLTFDTRTPENLRQTIQLLEQAVAHDANFLLAYCLLARAHAYIYFSGIDHSANRRTIAQEAVDTALRMGPRRAEPRLAAAFVAYQCFRDYDSAAAELAVARQGLPNDPTAFSLPAFIARRQGNWEECIRNFERAVELDVGVDDANTRVARALVDLETRGDPCSAHDAIQKALAADPSAVDAIAEQWLYVALCRRDAAEITSALASIPQAGIVPFTVRMPRPFCVALGARARGNTSAAEMAFKAARAEMENILREEPDYPEGLSILAMIDAALGKNEKALDEGRRALELMPISKDAVTGAEVRRNLAITCAWMGERELALEVLEQALLQSGPISYGQLRLHPWWDPLRDDPRFEKIMEEAKKPVALK